jgi:hypothetical protein
LKLIKPEAQLEEFLDKYTPEIAAFARAALAKMRKRLPGAVQLVYDNYNALVIGFSPTEKASHAIFSIALYPRWVTLFFLQGKKLRDPDKILKVGGSTVRSIVLDSLSRLDDPAVKDLMAAAQEVAVVPIDPKGPGGLIIKSISAKQRPRRPVARN